MATNVTFQDQQLSLQDVIDLFSVELRSLKTNISTLNDTLALRNQEPGSSHTLNETTAMDFTMAQQAVQKPSFELVSVLPSFSGDDSERVGEFLARINEVGSLSNWTETNKLVIAKLKLSGTAQTFCKTDELCKNATTLHELQNALESRFKDNLPDHYYLEQLACIRQEKGETIERYADRVKILGSKTFKPTQNAEVDNALRKEGDRRSMDAFTRGLFGELGRQVRIRFPKSLQEAVTLAIAMRDVERRPSDERSHHKDKSFSNQIFTVQTPAYSQLQNTRPQRFTPQQQHFTQPAQNHFSFRPRGVNNSTPRFTSNKQCNFCKRQGHLEIECRTKMRSFSQTPTQIQCQSCQRYGHTIANCRSRPQFQQTNYNHTQQNKVPSNLTGDLTTATGTPRQN